MSVASHEYAKVVDAHLLETIEFTAETLSVAALSLTSEDGSIPEICADIIIWFTIAHEMTVLDSDIGMLLVWWHSNGCLLLCRAGNKDGN